MRERAAVPDRRLLGLPRAQRAGLRLAQRLGEPVDAADANALLQRRVAARAHGRAPRLAADTVHRGLHDELQERVAIEVRADRLTQAPHRVLHPLALLGEIRQALLELLRHPVELLASAANRPPDGGHARREVSASQPPGRVEELHDLTPQRPGHGEGEGHRQDEEAGEYPPAMMRLFATWPVVSALGASTATRMCEPSIPGAPNVA